MKRVGHWLFNLAAAVSVTLLIATLMLWGRSYFVSDALAYLNGSGDIAVQAASGVIIVGHSNVGHLRTTLRLDHFKMTFPLWEPSTPISIYNRFGFGYRASSVVTASLSNFRPTSDVVLPPVINNWTVYIPFWLVAICSAGMTCLLLHPIYRAKRRARLRLCVACGYDLRATPDRCPECGAIPSAAKGAAT